LGDTTLRRFYALHFLLPFVIVVLRLGHLSMLHQVGSSNPLGRGFHEARVPFHPYYTIKDLVGVLVSLTVLLTLVLLFPDLFAEPENFMPADPIVTPKHIKPEWYYL